MYNIVCTEPLWWVLTSKVPITLYRISLHLLINRSMIQGSFWNIYPNLIQNSMPMKFRGPINETVANKTLCIWFDGSLIIPYWFRISIIICGQSYCVQETSLCSLFSTCRDNGLCWWISLPYAFCSWPRRPVLGVGSSSPPSSPDGPPSLPPFHVVSDRVPYFCVHEAVEQSYQESLKEKHFTFKYHEAHYWIYFNHC